LKRTTANSNNVTVTRTSAAADSKVKSKSKNVLDSKDNGPEAAIEMQEEDDSHEEAAALASPVKGSESRKMSKVSHYYILSLI
jgi:hypothetical protein